MRRTMATPGQLPLCTPHGQPYSVAESVPTALHVLKPPTHPMKAKKNISVSTPIPNTGSKGGDGVKEEGGTYPQKLLRSSLLLLQLSGLWFWGTAQVTSPLAHAGPAPSTHSWQFFDQLHSSPNRCVFAITTPISRAESASGLINMLTVLKAGRNKCRRR